ncbi:MAG TPA: hypothetical protein VE553_00965 [Candidatus Binatia bacterium]|nr:hypothetical protein [Candidatus Binatia bacterium]
MKRARGTMGPQYLETVWLWTEPIDGAANGSSHKTQEGGTAVCSVQLENKVALIVGGASDAGGDLALSFAERGMDVAIIFYEGRQQRASAIKERIEELGRRCLLIHGEESNNLGHEPFARWAVDTILATLGRLDVYINVSERQFAFAPAVADGRNHGALQSSLFPHLPILKAALNKIVG